MKTFVAVVVLLLTFNAGFCQQKPDVVYVDKKGVMRWRSTNEEIRGFGVNYTAPFAHAYRSAKLLNVDLEKAIDDDVYHFARLGFDAYRVHVWDTEISDSLGNLIDNDHLRLFDYLSMKLKERGIRMLITPIAFWGNGYPEPDEKTPGFSRKYGKDNCLVNEDAIRAQENYLRQFLKHVNPYTKLAYKDDPDIIAFEISNEPHHRGTPKEVTAFINRMSRAMRSTGCTKPVFYNISHSVHLSDAYFNAEIQGGTFQWYPTGLGARHELRGNFLPNVDNYSIPFATDPKFKARAKVVYEFDAADVGRSYVYPAMARSFRTAGMQWATHFAYDPTFMAYANTEYNTHYMNLAYAPQKALSLKLASEVFHRVPMYKDYGKYPANTRFDGFHLSYEDDLAEFMNDTRFIYTNTTTTKPSAPEKLDMISGAGDSPVVAYEGTGAYFLDKLESGVWRLEVMPDAIWVNNPFGQNSLKKEVAVINWRSWPMTVSLPDLGENFAIRKITGGAATPLVNGKSFDAVPGVYLLTRRGVTSTLKDDSRWKNIRLNEFAAPLATVKKTYMLHEPASGIVAGKGMRIEAQVVSREMPQSVTLIVYNGFRPEMIEMKRTRAYTYTATIDDRVVREGYLRYYIVVREQGVERTFPPDVAGSPMQWDFFSDNAYKVPVVPADGALYLFNAFTDADELSREWRRGSSFVPGDRPQTAEVHIRLEQLFVPDPENTKAEPIFDYSLRYQFGKKIAARAHELPKMKRIVVKGRSLDEGPCTIQVALVTRQGEAYGALLTLGKDAKDHAVALSDLKPVKLVTLPRPYPTFLPYFFDGALQGNLDLQEAETIQLSIGPGLRDDEKMTGHGISIESIRLE